MKKIIIVGLGGFMGSALRYMLSITVYRLLGTNFPYGTFVVNVLGSFLIGFVMGLVENGVLITSNWRVFVTIGLLGGFTTFSSFSHETVQLLKQGAILTAVANVVYTVLSCLAATWAAGIGARLLTNEILK